MLYVSVLLFLSSVVVAPSSSFLNILPAANSHAIIGKSGIPSTRNLPVVQVMPSRNIRRKRNNNKRLKSKRKAASQIAPNSINNKTPGLVSNGIMDMKYKVDGNTIVNDYLKNLVRQVSMAEMDIRIADSDGSKERSVQESESPSSVYTEDQISVDYPNIKKELASARAESEMVDLTDMVTNNLKLNDEEPTEEVDFIVSPVESERNDVEDESSDASVQSQSDDSEEESREEIDASVQSKSDGGEEESREEVDTAIKSKSDGSDQGNLAADSETILTSLPPADQTSLDDSNVQKEIAVLPEWKDLTDTVNNNQMSADYLQNSAKEESREEIDANVSPVEYKSDDSDEDNHATDSKTILSSVYPEEQISVDLNDISLDDEYTSISGSNDSPRSQTGRNHRKNIDDTKKGASSMIDDLEWIEIDIPREDDWITVGNSDSVSLLSK